ncbi:MAG: diguanylate cyclase [Spirochaetes bacterium]|jgi:GGDEF domain-containing protein|nr:diguanylate cyclase [Spirochaetota bacterium]
MSKKVHIVEIIVTSVLLGIADAFLPSAAGFASVFHLPYLFVALFFASYLGYFAGYMSLGCSAIVVSGPLPGALVLLQGSDVAVGYWSSLAGSAAIPVAVAVVMIYLFGQIRIAQTRRTADTQARLEDVTRQHWNEKQKAHALELSNRELEERVARQRESLSSLYTQLEKLKTLDIDRCLNVLLETINIFTGARRASVHSFDGEAQQLKRAAQWVPEGSAAVESTLKLDGTIEGWVFRNDSMFSVRMLISLDTLRHMDTGRNILTLPIHVRRRVWGVLNIEDMPFEKYNLYSERILHIVLSLAEPALERAVEHQRIIDSQEVDSETGLPFVSLFFREVEEYVRDVAETKSTMTVVILEIVNFARIAQEHGTRPAKSLWVRLTEELTKLSEHKASFYHYKEDNQVAALFPGLDQDGASLFCLETLEMLNTQEWTVGDVTVPLEVAIGFASLSGDDMSATQLIEQAETLLEMQRE